MTHPIHLLTHFQVNMEMFAERLQDGEHGENNGANIVNANPFEIAQRMTCYLEHNLAIGACWALPHWFVNRVLLALPM